MLSLNLNSPFDKVGIETTMIKHITDVTAAETEIIHPIQQEFIVPPTMITRCIMSLH